MQTKNYDDDDDDKYNENCDLKPCGDDNMDNHDGSLFCNISINSFF